jgi:hypothetical protein
MLPLEQVIEREEKFLLRTISPGSRNVSHRKKDLMAARSIK